MSYDDFKQISWWGSPVQDIVEKLRNDWINEIKMLN